MNSLDSADCEVCTSPKNVQMLFWDLETKQLIQDVRGISRVEKIANLEISCVSYLTLTSLSEIETAEVTTLWFDAETGFAPLLDAFDKATKIVSYNGICFDHLVLKKHYEDVNPMQVYTCKHSRNHHARRACLSLWQPSSTKPH